MAATKTDDEAQRWIDARSVVDGEPTATARERIRRFYRVYYSTAGIATVSVSVAFGLSHHHLRIRLPSSPTTHVLGWAVVVVGLALELAGVAWVLRRKRPRGAVRGALLCLTRGQRRDVVRRIRRNMDVTEDHEVGVYAAGVLERQRPGACVMIGLIVSQAGLALTDESVSAVVVVLVVVGLAATSFALRDARLARTWLATHHGPDPLGPDGTADLRATS